MKQSRLLQGLRRYVAAALVAVFFCMLAIPAPLAAQAVVQSYIADDQLQPGMVVQLADTEFRVKPAIQSAPQDAYGLVVPPNDAPLSLSDEKSAAGNLVYVATTGTYRMLVSNQNGAIRQGDYVSVSAIEGIGMRVDSSAQYVVGKAVSGFDGVSGSLSQVDVKDADGNERTVKIGYIEADITIRRNPMYVTPTSNVPGALQRFADAIAGKPVGNVRVYVSFAVALVTGLVAVAILYAGIRASMIALGRNPLARGNILRNLIRVVLVGLIVLIIGLFAVYLLLRF